MNQIFRALAHVLIITIKITQSHQITIIVVAASKDVIDVPGQRLHNVFLAVTTQQQPNRQ
jgi:hypothetical protein